MAGFVLGRMLWAVPILLLGLTITFFMLRASGGSPFRHGPLLGLGSPAWAKYNDRPPESIASNMALSLLPMAYCVRLVRGAMLETLAQDYVRTAVAKGLRRRTVVTRHGSGTRSSPSGPPPGRCSASCSPGRS